LSSLASIKKLLLFARGSNSHLEHLALAAKPAILADSFERRLYEQKENEKVDPRQGDALAAS
jgi:hypothetical protein